ncbi:hypothetical protein V3C99_006272, partial [Haemonchus contortus]
PPWSRRIWREFCRATRNSRTQQSRRNTGSVL